jgi:ribosomal-protein-alanine N-acetyltransferase
MTIATHRLHIRPMTTLDNEFVWNLLNSDAWIQYIGNRNINSLADADAYIDKIRNNSNVCYWTVGTKGEGERAGLVTLIQRDYLDAFDIGFAFLPEYWGCGYAFEAVTAVLQHLSLVRPQEKIYAVTLPENAASIKLLGKLGFELDRKLDQPEALLLYKLQSL